MENYQFIINPASRGGRNKNEIINLKSWVQRYLPRARWEETEKPGHASTLVQKGAQEGFRTCICVGGDGTLHEIVNGICLLPKNQRPNVGIVSMGTGGDFARQLRKNFGTPKDFDWLLDPKEKEIDIGLAKIKDKEGNWKDEFFVNIASVGISGEVVRRVSSSKRSFGPLEYLKALIGTALNYRPHPVTVQWNSPGKKSEDLTTKLMLLVVANSNYFGGGMCIAPKAKIDDGQFDILLTEKVSYLAMLAQLTLVYRGKPTSHKKVHYRRGEKMSIRSQNGKLPVDLDGEFFSASEIQFQIIPQALKVLIPKPRFRRS